MRSWATLLATRWPKMRSEPHLGLHLDGSWGKMALSWPTWRQDVPNMANLEAKMANLAHFWEILATFFGSWARSCQKWRKPKKRRQYSTFEGFLGCCGCSWRLCWLILALCWAMLGHLGAILEQLGDKMRPESAKMIQDSAQERQDEAR